MAHQRATQCCRLLPKIACPVCLTAFLRPTRSLSTPHTNPSVTGTDRRMSSSMRTRSREAFDPLSPLPARPPPPPPPLPQGVRPRVRPPREEPPQQQQQQKQQQQQQHTPQSQQSPQQPSPGRRREGPVVVRTERGVQTATETPDWVLRLQIRRHDGRPYTMLDLHITGDMRAPELAACLRQAHDSVPAAAEVVLSTPLVGVFCEHRHGLFVTLEHLLATPALHTKVVSLAFCPPPARPPRPTPWYRQQVWLWIMLALLIPLGLAGLYQAVVIYGVELWMAGAWIVASTFDVVVQLPLQELYRYGPWFIGWEGSTLPAVCARITYYGDVAFWNRNLEECQDIYQAKEEAFLRLARPTLYTIGLGVLLWLVREVLQHRIVLARHRAGPATAPPPADMVDTYRAFQILLRQVRKGLDSQQQQQQQQEQQQQRPALPQGNMGNHNQHRGGGGGGNPNGGHAPRW